MIITPFQSTASALHSRRLVQFTLQAIWAKTTLTVTAFESAHTYSAHPTIPHDVSTLHCTRNLRLADPNDTSPDPLIQVLIGGDHYWKLIKDNPPLRISPSLVLLPSTLGWILSGNRSGVSVHHVAINNIELCQDFDFRDSQIRHFWSLEAMGIRHWHRAASHQGHRNASLFFGLVPHRRRSSGCVAPEERAHHPSWQPDQRAKALPVPDEKVRHWFRLQNDVRKQNTGLHTSTSSQSCSAQPFCSTKVLPAAPRGQERKTYGRKMGNRFWRLFPWARITITEWLSGNGTQPPSGNPQCPLSIQIT